LNKKGNGVQSKGIVIIRVERTEQSRWHVLENDFEDPLAAFDDRQSACDYANKLSVNRNESTVVLLDETVNTRTGVADQNRAYLSR
jgi:hypothetical protein